MSITSAIDNKSYTVYIPATNNITNSNNYYSTSYGTNFYNFTSVSTFTNNYIILAAGGLNGSNVNSVNPVSTQTGGHAINNNSGNTINNLFNYGALLGGGGSGGGNTGGGRGGNGGAGGGGGASGFYGGGDGGSLVYGAGLNGTYGGGGGPYQSGASYSTYSGGTGGGAPGGSGYAGNSGTNTFGFIYGGGAGWGINNGGSIGGGGGYGGGNGLISNYGSGGGGGGGIGGKGSGLYPGGNGGYSIYNSGTISNLTNGQGGTNYIYGPCFYAGNAPTNYYIHIQSASRYGQLFCTGWGTTTGNINFGIDQNSTFNSSSITTLYYVLVGVTPNSLFGKSIGSLYGYLWNLTYVAPGSSIFGVYAYHLNVVVYQIYNKSNILSTNALNNSYYRHVALTISGNTHTLYLDGSAVATNTNALNIFNYYPSTISNLLIGSAADLSYGYTGYIDDFKIWGRALPASDISALYYNLPAPSVPSNLALIDKTNYSASISFSMATLTNTTKYSVTSSPSVTTTVTGNNTQLDISGLASNTIYTVNVVASNSAGSSTSSAFSLITSDFSTGYDSTPCFMDFSGNYIYYPNYNTNTIIQTNLTNGSITNSTFISNIATSTVSGPSCCVVYNNNLYVSTSWYPKLSGSNPGNVDTIYVYNLLSPGTRTNLFGSGSTPYSCIQAMCINGNNLYFLQTGGGSVVRCYNLTTNTITWTSVALSYSGTDLVFCNGNIYVPAYNGYITKINSTNGSIITNNWYTNVYNLYGITAYNTYLYVGNLNLTTIMKIDTSSGSANVINPDCVPYMISPISMRIYNNYMYVSNGYRMFRISIP